MKVNIIIGGFQKCGTTALHRFLSTHRMINSSNPKELDYFNYDVNFGKGETYYHSFFSRRGFFFYKKLNYLEASPSYLSDCNAKVTSERIHKYNNKMKIIVLVRNPIDRAFSAWQMYRKRYFSGDTEWWINWMEKRSGVKPNVVRRSAQEYLDFNVFVKNELEVKMKGLDIECGVLKNGEYYDALVTYKEKFGDNLFIIKNESLDLDTVFELNRVSKFIGLNKYDWGFTKEQKIFKGNYNSKIDNDSKNLLKDYYREHNEKLFGLTSIKY